MKIFEKKKFLKIFEKNIRKNKSTILTKNKLQRIAKNKLQIGKFVKNHSGSNKSVTFLLVCRNLPGKANLIMHGKEISNIHFRSSR